MHSVYWLAIMIYDKVNIFLYLVLSLYVTSLIIQYFLRVFLNFIARTVLFLVYVTSSNLILKIDVNSKNGLKITNNKSSIYLF